MIVDPYMACLSVFFLQAGCAMEMEMLADPAVPSVNPFEKEYLQRIKQEGAMDSVLRIVSIKAKSTLPTGATLNTSTGIFGWRPAATQSTVTGKAHQVTLVATGSRGDTSEISITFKVESVSNVALCKQVIAFADEKKIPDKTSTCTSKIDPNAITDGARPAGITWSDVGQVLPFVVIDLEKKLTIQTILVFQPSGPSDRMKEVTISVSDDNKEFNAVAEGSLAVNDPGLLGRKFNLNTAGRYVKIQTDKRVSSGYGIGEVEIYSKTLTDGPSAFTATGNKLNTQIKLEWANPQKFDKVQIVRKKLEKPGSMENYPASFLEGTKVYVNKRGKLSCRVSLSLALACTHARI